MIEHYKSKGFYIDECRLEGATKSANCFPAQHNTIQLSRNRWFVIFNTRGFRGNDDHRSVVYQIRADAPDGRVLTEGYLDEQTMEWDPLGDGRKFVKLCTHLVAFGVPVGALIGGRRVPHEGCFVAVWTRFPRIYDPARDYLLHDAEGDVPREGYRCPWVQFRLGESGDDIEIVQTICNLQEKGFAGSSILCRHEHLDVFNSGYVNPVPYNCDYTEWAFLVHWNRGAIESEGVCTAIRLKWNPQTLLYEWTDTGPILDGPGDMGIFEGGIAPFRGDWLVSARIVPRKYMGNVWFRTDDLFGPAPEPFYSPEIRSDCPRTTFLFPDDVIRVFTTDQVASPYGDNVGLPDVDGKRDVRVPLHAMDIDSDNQYRVVRTDVVFDTLKEGIPIRMESGPCANFCQLVPHIGGSNGYISYSIRPKALKHPKAYFGRFKGQVNAEEMQVSGVYYSEVSYDRDYPPTWQFG